MRKILNGLYRGAGGLAAVFMVGTLAMVVTGVLGRLLNFNLRGTDSYAGFSMAAGFFLALAYTLNRGEHIRVTLLLQQLGPRATKAAEIICHGIGVLLAWVLAWFSARLVWQSYTFHDVSQGMDATPLWIPQLAMAVGTVVLAIALSDRLILILAGRNWRADERSDVTFSE